MTTVQIMAATVLAALFFIVLGGSVWYWQEQNDIAIAEDLYWQEQNNIAIAEDLARLRSKLEPIPNTYGHTRTPAELALDTIRTQAIATARHDICQPLGVPLTPNPHAQHTVQHNTWALAYARTLGGIDNPLAQPEPGTS